jgi:hypothetical protein
VAFHLAYFYTFLKPFDLGFEFLALLLKTMQLIRRRVPAVADYLQTRDKDTFTGGDVQQRVFRFFLRNRAAEHDMRSDIREYLSHQPNEKRRTLLGIY